ncbi:bacterial transcriptional activator domain-containing protein [Paenibacillus barcinonensis]|uniref:tetratricopeptide repeat protein n=1 Tax=Paenibacillus TaxID=44249 RepID=UPI001C11170D|nr:MULTISPECIES: CDC27 family protein [Paenibacillus]MBU5354835.1 bacterial transcriptional activator domain-containing protein [Paenibacillus barcinonensis]MDM5275838.1 tetratricopeptide repeat protein [Paenibacillus silvae]
MSKNQRAIECYENNEYDAALALFRAALSESRDVQSLTNLAWIYYHEEGDVEAAMELLQEALNLNPTSHFPYSLLGELLVREQRWAEGAAVLLRSIAIETSKEAVNNLAVAKYHLGEWDQAAALFLQSAEPSDYAMYSHIYCLIKMGRMNEAKHKLHAFSEQDEHFAGEVHVAELYVELQCFSEAVHWFKKSWNTYYKSPDWVCRYIYALVQMNAMQAAIEITEQCIQLKQEDIEEEQAELCDEEWTESDKAVYLKQLEMEKQEYMQILAKISEGYVPPLDFMTSVNSACYLFGCSRHGHSEYKD